MTEIETIYGGELDLRERPTRPLLPYHPTPFGALQGAAAPHVDGEAKGEIGVGAGERKAGTDVDAERDEAQVVSAGCEGSVDTTRGAGNPLQPESASNGLRLVTSDLAPADMVRQASVSSSSSAGRAAKCASVGSGRHESEDEFMTPVASPVKPQLDRASAFSFTGQQVHDETAEGQAVGGRSREAIFVGANDQLEGSRKGMIRASSELELVAHKKQVLESAHGGVWDAHSSTERAVLMKAAIHSMTEAGLDEEVAQKVFQLDSTAVAHILSAAASSAQGASPRGVTSCDELLRVAREYGLVGDGMTTEVEGAAVETERGQENGQWQEHQQPKKQPETPPAAGKDPAVPPPLMDLGDERLPPSSEILITDDYLRAIHRSHFCTGVCACKQLCRVSCCCSARVVA